MAHVTHITERALREIDEALKWRAQRSITRAVRWYVELMASIRSLEENPERCPLAPESEWFPSVRQRIHGKRRGTYRILFEIRGDTVYILRVRSGVQDLLGPDDL
jgi:plasmid stabilization system protein ParE